MLSPAPRQAAQAQGGVLRDLHAHALERLGAPALEALRIRRAVRGLAEVLQELRRALAIAMLNAVAETLWLHEGPPPGVQVQEGEACHFFGKSVERVCLCMDR